MEPRGFEEEDTAYAADDPQRLVGQFRRFSAAGPAYEILRIMNETEAWVLVVYSGEEVAVPIKDILEDPIAETIP